VDVGISLYPSRLSPLPFLFHCHAARVHGVCRLSKERTLYAKENQDQKLKVDKLVASNGDEWDIKNGVRSIHALSLLDPCPKHPKGGPPSALTRNTDLVEQKRMLEESERMILDTNKRLGAAVQELRDLVVGFPPTSPFSLPS